MRSYEATAIDALARAIERSFIDQNATEHQNVCDSLDGIWRAINNLGNANAATPMGAIEAHGAAMLDASENIASGLHDMAEAIRDHTERG